MVERFTEAEVAERAGTTPERIASFAELGILERIDGTYHRRDVLRARFVLGLDSLGMDETAVADAISSGDLTLGYVEIGGRRPPRSEMTFAELAGEIGITFMTLERIYVAFGLPRPTADEHVREEDEPLMRFIPVLVEAGVTEGELLRLARVWGDSVRKVAQFQNHFMHHSIEAPFRASGLRDNAAFEAALREVGVRTGRSGEVSWAGCTGVTPRSSRPSTSSTMSRPPSRTRGCIARSPDRSKAACSRTSPATRG